MIKQDTDEKADTSVIYAFKEGSGVGQHPNSNRGAAVLNFVTESVESQLEATNFVSLHGALLLVAWLLVAPIGLYYAR